jgi:hypothetical protein
VYSVDSDRVQCVVWCVVFVCDMVRCIENAVEPSVNACDKQTNKTLYSLSLSLYAFFWRWLTRRLLLMMLLYIWH